MAGPQEKWQGSGMQQITELQGAVDSRRIQQLAPVLTVSSSMRLCHLCYLACRRCSQHIAPAVAARSASEASWRGRGPAASTAGKCQPIGQPILPAAEQAAGAGCRAGCRSMPANMSTFHVAPSLMCGMLQACWCKHATSLYTRHIVCCWCSTSLCMQASHPILSPLQENSSKRAAAAAASPAVLSSSSDPDVPEGVSPSAWAALLQTAKEMDLRGGHEALNGVLNLRQVWQEAAGGLAPPASNPCKHTRCMTNGSHASECAPQQHHS